MVTPQWVRARNVAIPLAVLALIVVVDALLPPRIVISGAFAVAAIVASAIATVRQTALVAVAAFLLTALSAVWNQNFMTVDWWVRLVTTILIGALAVVLAEVRVRRELSLQQMTAIAEAAQRALLRAMPSSIASLGFAARYVSAAHEALVGGDLYEVVETDTGVRVIVGDVRGKGLDAVQMAATVLAAFRRVAVTAPSLAAAAKHLDEVVGAVAGDEDFVTVLLGEFHEDGTVELVNCGHPPPLLITAADGGRLVDSGVPTVPLGLGPSPEAVTVSLPDRARLLFYTDGLVETRNVAGAFFPLDDRVAAALHAGALGDALDVLLTLLDRHADHHINDDVALLLVENRASA